MRHESAFERDARISDSRSDREIEEDFDIPLLTHEAWLRSLPRLGTAKEEATEPPSTQERARSYQRALIEAIPSSIADGLIRVSVLLPAECPWYLMELLRESPEEPNEAAAESTESCQRECREPPEVREAAWSSPKFAYLSSLARTRIPSPNTSASSSTRRAWACPRCQFPFPSIVSGQTSGKKSAINTSASSSTQRAWPCSRTYTPMARYARTLIVCVHVQTHRYLCLVGIIASMLLIIVAFMVRDGSLKGPQKDEQSENLELQKGIEWCHQTERHTDRQWRDFCAEILAQLVMMPPNAISNSADNLGELPVVNSPRPTDNVLKPSAMVVSNPDYGFGGIVSSSRQQSSPTSTCTDSLLRHSHPGSHLGHGSKPDSAPLQARAASPCVNSVPTLKKKPSVPASFATGEDTRFAAQEEGAGGPDVGKGKECRHILMYAFAVWRHKTSGTSDTNSFLHCSEAVTTIPPLPAAASSSNSTENSNSRREPPQWLNEDELKYEKARCMDCGVPICQSDTDYPTFHGYYSTIDIGLDDNWHLCFGIDSNFTLDQCLLNLSVFRYWPSIVANTARHSKMKCSQRGPLRNAVHHRQSRHPDEAGGSGHRR
ncbi:hypothetical protein BU23DRAFT_569287 [Bimuria novae-zelandiae CBS 107.79]|uniref:Uncharacterized protein n=1 Tax=Bimuria novae-zelandiae CBS 107.79 TaxID=1447943 RepID=A0A6A5V5F9_9PLEO|nr:hypothetical protein BU23DRAFT_569287 [Bimuria novae-zelandiae CBS 107.79]